jgi:hypothetical protein
MDAPCASCGAPTSAMKSLELALPAADPGARRARRRDEAPELPIELAYDPRWARSGTGLVPGEVAEPRAPVPPQPSLRLQTPAARKAADDPFDIVSDARLLADYGAPPDRWIACAAYAWRVLRKRRQLARALSTRREEAKRAASEHEDALVAFAEQARPTAEQRPAYADPIERLRRSEEVLVKRRDALAAQNDADSLRLASIDASISRLEAERDRAANEERLAATELAGAQSALEQEESALKRAEMEARAAQQRERTGG